MLKILSLVGLLVACGSPSEPRNLASEYVLAVEPDAKCSSYYQDAEPNHTFSATCRLPSKLIVYCMLAADRTPVCQPINGDKPPPAAATPAAMAPPATPHVDMPK